MNKSPLHAEYAVTGNVYYFHIRNLDDSGKPLGYGGMTVAAMVDEQTIIFDDKQPTGLVFTYSRCSKKDNFNKKIGRRIAETRLLSWKANKNYYINGTDIIKFEKWLRETYQG